MNTGVVLIQSQIGSKQRSQFMVAVAVWPERGSVSRSRWGEAADEPARGMARGDARPTKCRRAAE
jgi:hypothetical protein